MHETFGELLVRRLAEQNIKRSKVPTLLQAYGVSMTRQAVHSWVHNTNCPSHGVLYVLLNLLHVEGVERLPYYEACALASLPHLAPKVPALGWVETEPGLWSLRGAPPDTLTVSKSHSGVGGVTYITHHKKRLDGLYKTLGEAKQRVEDTLPELLLLSLS
jgi:hypothetical protein